MLRGGAIEQASMMPLTSDSDIYFAIHDAGINRVVKHVMRQRPSLFNYGTALVAADPQLLCSPVDVDPRVTAADNPIVTVMPPLPVITTPYAMNYCAQVGGGQIDFAPGNIISLPAALNPPLPDQRLAVRFSVCAGLGCPPRRVVTKPPGLAGTLAAAEAKLSRGSRAQARRRQKAVIAKERVVANPIVAGGLGVARLPGLGPTVIPTQELDCFCLDLFATAGCSITGPVGSQTIRPTVDGINIAGLQPTGLEESIVCYAKVALNEGILPKLGQTASQLAFGLFTLPASQSAGDLEVSGDLQVSASTSVPNNPAIQDDQLEVFIDIDRIDLDVTLNAGGGGGSSGGGGGGGTVTRTTRARTRTGTFDLTGAVSAGTLSKLFDAFMKGFKFKASGSSSYGPFTVGYDVAAHLESGSISLTSAGGIELKDMVVRWDTLSLTLGVQLPNVCTPGFCLVPIPFDGCAVYISPQCIWSSPPEISFTIDLGGFLDSKATLTGIPRVFYGVGSGVTNRWQVAVEPVLPILIDIVDLADTAGDLFNTLVTGAIDSLISGLPGWAKDLINSVLGGVDDIIRTVLGIPDDIITWLEDLISSLGIYQDLVDALAQYISITVFELDDPFQALPADGALIPVMLPIQYLGITVDASEMVIRGDIGD